jgi:glycosyltransferase involved in cell wall biosynthesis
VKLGVVTTSYPRFAGDPAGNFVAGHVRALRRLGHEVEVIAAGAGAADDGTDGTDDAVPVLRIPGSLFYRGGAPDRLERAPLRAGAAAALFTARLTAAVAARAPRWDAVIAHWLAPSAIAALPARAPMLAIAHGGDVFTLRRWHLLRPVLHALHHRDARLVFVSEQLRAIARDAASASRSPALRAWLDAARVQPMGIELARFAALAGTLAGAPADPPIVLVAARLVPVKGVDVAVAAMRHVRGAARLVIAGDGPERARLAADGDRVRLLGEVTTERRDDLLRAASVVVVSSRITPGGRTEGTPAIAIEALAAGVPVIASAVGGLRDLPGVRLVPPDDPVALARAIDQQLAEPLSPGRRAALRAGVARFDWREVVPRLTRE